MRHVVQVTTSNTALANPFKKVLVGGAGTLVVDTKGGEANVTIAGIIAGTQLDIEVTKIYTTSTATNITGFY